MRDLLLSHPEPQNLVIVPTARYVYTASLFFKLAHFSHLTPLFPSDPKTSLALSSRNAYLTPYEREHVAPVLYAALLAATTAWKMGATKGECMRRAGLVIDAKKAELEKEGETNLRRDYIEMNDPETFDVVEGDVCCTDLGDGKVRDHPVIVSGAMW